MDSLLLCTYDVHHSVLTTHNALAHAHAGEEEIANEAVGGGGHHALRALSIYRCWYIIVDNPNFGYRVLRPERNGASSLQGGATGFEKSTRKSGAAQALAPVSRVRLLFTALARNSTCALSMRASHARGADSTRRGSELDTRDQSCRPLGVSCRV